jgi:hypothetical protein
MTPAQAPEPILERASHLARLSRLSRRSNVPLARLSKQLSMQPGGYARRSVEPRGEDGPG